MRLGERRSLVAMPNCLFFAMPNGKLRLVVANPRRHVKWLDQALFEQAQAAWHRANRTQQ